MANASPATETLSDNTKMNFGRFKVRLAELLTTDIIISLSTFFMFPPAKIDELRHTKNSPGRLMVSLLEERGQIKPNDISPLLTALDRLQLHGLLSTLHRIFQGSEDKTCQFVRYLQTFYKQLYSNINPIPYIREKVFRVNDIFVEGGIEMHGRHDKEIERPLERNRMEPVKLNSYRDVFNDDIISSKRILLEGDPGCGKSTLTLQAAYDWCNASDSSPLKDVAIFILLPLRLLGGIFSIFLAIKLMLMPGESNLTEEDIMEILLNSRCVMMILDGYDEYPDKDISDQSEIMKIIAGNMFANFKVITCTRSSYIPDNLYVETVNVRLTGFDENARDNYIRRAVSVNDNQAARRINALLTSSPMLSDICQVPLFCVMFVHISSEEERVVAFASVTSCFSHILTCFYAHMWNKMGHARKPNDDSIIPDYPKLNKLVFDALTGKNQQIVWQKNDFKNNVGDGCYNELITIGILIEEGILKVNYKPGMAAVPFFQQTTVVRFYHKLFAEWYAANYLSKYAGSKFPLRLQNKFEKINPVDLQFVFIFACGLNKKASSRIIEYLKEKEDWQSIVSLCFFEQVSEPDDVVATVEDLCTAGLTISSTDNKLSQSSTMQIIDIAAKSDFTKKLEDKRQELSHIRTEAEDEKQHLPGRLKITDDERQHLKDTLKATKGERQQLKGTLKTIEEEKQQFEDVLKATEEERQQLNGRLKTIDEERQQLKYTLATTEEERQTLSERLKTTEEEKQQLLCTMTTTEEERQQLSERLKTTEKERQQFKDTLKATEEEKQQLSQRLKTTEKERQQLKDTLKATEDVRQQFKDTLKATEEERQQLSERIKTTEEEIHQFNDTLKATEEERQQLSQRLKTAEKERQQYKNSLKVTEEEKQQLSERLKKTEEELEEAKSSLRATKDELVKSQLEYAIESMALQEVLKHTRESLDQQELASYASVAAEETLLEECEAPDVSPESSLAADYGRLMVKVADDLTLDSTLKLATLFGLPPAETDMLRRVSLIETPGITLINFMNTRNIINMYDVTNLQKGLVYIQLNETNEYLLSPYQYKVDSFQFEDKQTPELLNWPVENVKSVPDDASTPSQASEEREEYYDHTMESLTEREKLPKQRKGSKALEMRHHYSYIEHRIKCEGGTISIMGVHLTIPEDALSCEGVISVKVIYDSDIHLPGSARRGRMTPLIKLEPEGLALNKPAQLILPHSAIIPEPDRHDVIIFTGLKDVECLREGEITWTEDKSVHWKLDPEMISLDINILSYVFVNLVSQATEQKHIFRIVPFIDGILDAKDDVLITVCFCKDSDEEYKLLLEDHQSKLSLGNYTTFQVTRTLNDGRDYASCIDLMMSLPVDSYHLMKKESTKHVDIDHLCAASRVSHQFRLKRNNDGHTDMVDVKLTVSQHETNKIALILQSKVKNILLSPESHNILFRERHSDVHQFEKLKRDIAKLLDKQHCGKLSMFFGLEPAENDTIQEAAESGKMLMKILDERELIMPDRMIGLHEGLKAIHFNKVARLVLEYIDTLQEKHGRENEGEKDDKKMVKVSGKQEVISKRKPQLSINLIEEGYKRRDVQSALNLSRGKLDLGRRILLLVREEHERLHLFPGSNLYKEQYFDKHGGEVVIAGVSLIVPAGALHTGRIVSLWVSTDPAIKGPISKKSLRLTPFVKFGPESLTLHKPVTLIIPHCALTTTNQMSIDVYSGVSQTDKSVKWSLERKHLNCSMKGQQLAVKAQQPCLIGLHVPFIPKLRKRVCILPIVHRVSDSGDQLTIHLWFHNEHTLEHEILINEEIYQQKGTIVHDPVSVLLKSMTSTLHVSTNSNTAQCNPRPRKVDVAGESLWLKNRYKVEFHLSNEGIKDTINLEISAKFRMSVKKDLFHLNIQLQMDKLLHIDQITSPFQLVLPEFIFKSFDQLKQNLSEHLDKDQSTLLAIVFQLPEEGITDIKKHKTPGTLLLEKLSKTSLISPTNITTLENALTEQGNEECAKLVRDFRWKNPVVQATLCPE